MQLVLSLTRSEIIRWFLVLGSTTFFPRDGRSYFHSRQVENNATADYNALFLLVLLLQSVIFLWTPKCRLCSHVQAMMLLSPIRTWVSRHWIDLFVAKWLSTAHLSQLTIDSLRIIQPLVLGNFCCFFQWFIVLRLWPPYSNLQINLVERTILFLLSRTIFKWVQLSNQRRKRPKFFFCN